MLFLLLAFCSIVFARDCDQTVNLTANIHPCIPPHMINNDICNPPGYGRAILTADEEFLFASIVVPPGVVERVLISVNLNRSSVPIVIFDAITGKRLRIQILNTSLAKGHSVFSVPLDEPLVLLTQTILILGSPKTNLTRSTFEEMSDSRTTAFGLYTIRSPGIPETILSPNSIPGFYVHWRVRILFAVEGTWKPFNPLPCDQRKTCKECVVRSATELDYDCLWCRNENSCVPWEHNCSFEPNNNRNPYIISCKN